MLEITAAGTPYEIGLQHGRQAAPLVRGSIQFYQDYFARKSKLDWDAATAIAERFRPLLDKHVPHLVEEIQGIADGAEVPFSSILAVNVRSEISMGLMDEGCTALAWTTDAFSVAGQNWDWEDPQKERLVLVHVRPAASAAQRPNISYVAEAGIVGKIGLNAHGVSVFLNAIRAPGVNYDALPLHIALRVALEAPSRAKALARIRSVADAAATAGHILVADPTGATSLEFTAVDLVTLHPEAAAGKIAHTNHFLAEHGPGAPSGVPETLFADTYARQARITALLQAEAPPLDKNGLARVQALLSDEDGFPTSINRQSSAPANRSSTLFSIAVDTRARTAVVIEGRPTEHGTVYNIDLS